MNHDELVAAANEAIKKVFEDKSVDISETRISMNVLIDGINILLETLGD